MADKQSTPRRRPRKPISCEPCRYSKLKCDRQLPCASCKRRNIDSCSYKNPRRDRDQSSQSQSRSQSQSQSQPDDRPEVCHAWDRVLQRPAVDQQESAPSTFCFPFPVGPNVSTRELLDMVPPTHCCDYLITQYFTHVSPMFHILHGPTFNRQYQGFLQDPSSVSLSWLALLFLICSVTVNTLDGDDPALKDMWLKHPQRDNTEGACHLRMAAMICLSRDQFLIRHRLSTLEALLILIYTISHNEGVERSWTLLGVALNIGIALHCNTESPELNCIDNERRRRCWAGVLLLHTYQAILFRDIDMSSLASIQATMPADVNDRDILPDTIRQPSSQPTQMSVMMFKIRLFQLSSRLCRHISGPSRLDESMLDQFHRQIAKEQRQWDEIFLLDGSPSVLDTATYAHWCTLQLYAHQLYLLLHRPFCRSQSTNSRYRPASRTQCITSGAALLDFHRQLWELPRLRHYRWIIPGMCSFYALHGAVALASCLLDGTDTPDVDAYRAVFDAAVDRIEMLQPRSPICVQGYPVLRHLQTLLSPEQSTPDVGGTLDEWIDTMQWLNPESNNWNFWDSILNEPSDRTNQIAFASASDNP